MSEKTLVAAESILARKSALVSHTPQLDLPPHLLEHYNIICKRVPNPIVEMRNGTCLGCFMVLSSHHQQKVKVEDYDVCENCDRILYFEDY